MTPKNLEDALYCCLASKFVKINTYGAGTPDQALPTLQRDPGDHTHAFDPESGRNFAWDSHKQAWIDTKTGECICPAGCPATSTPTTQPTATPTQTPSGVGLNVKPGEFFVGYQFMRAPDESAKSLNGFNAQLFYNFNPHVGAGGEFGFASGSDQVGTTTDINLHRSTYLFGPQFNVYPNDKVRVFFRPLVGGVHDTTKVTSGTSHTDFSADAFMMSFGGGVDVNVSKHVAVRPFQFDYQPTHLGGEWQNNFRFSAGVVFRFGGNK
jgi:opacity protein-like surface antigen